MTNRPFRHRLVGLGLQASPITRMGRTRSRCGTVGHERPSTGNDGPGICRQSAARAQSCRLQEPVGRVKRAWRWCNRNARIASLSCGVGHASRWAFISRVCRLATPTGSYLFAATARPILRGMISDPPEASNSGRWQFSLRTQFVAVRRNLFVAILNRIARLAIPPWVVPGCPVYEPQTAKMLDARRKVRARLSSNGKFAFHVV